jgi:hypothetical protein
MPTVKNKEEQRSKLKKINNRKLCEISSPHGGKYEVQICLLGCTAVP